LGPVPVKGDAASAPAPRDANIVQGLGQDPLLESLFAERKQGRTTPLALLAHDVHTPLAVFASAAAARHANVLDDLAIKVVLGPDNAAKENPAVVAQASFWLAL
jgi:hypothetical protein